VTLRRFAAAAALALAMSAAPAAPEPRVLPAPPRIHDPSDVGLSRRARKRKHAAEDVTDARRRKISPAGLSRALARRMRSGYRPHGWHS